MKLFKFMIKRGDPRVLSHETLPDGAVRVITVDNRLAIALHETQEQALALLKRLGAEEGDDTRWLDVADVVVLDNETPKRVCWVEN